MQRKTRGLLIDIRDAAGFILEDTSDTTFDAFITDRRTRQLVERNFEIIGEALNRLARLEPEVVARISDYQQIIAFRNILIHGYDTINYHRVWQAIHDYLPILSGEVQALIADAER